MTVSVRLLPLLGDRDTSCVSTPFGALFRDMTYIIARFFGSAFRFRGLLPDDALLGVELCMDSLVQKSF